jgi:hypothetical protein
MLLDQYIQQLSKELELEDQLRSDVPGIFALPLEEDVTVMISALAQGFALNCGFSHIPSGRLEDFFERVLLADLFFQGTKGAVLGLNEDGNLLTLSQNVEYQTDYREFRDVLEDFINTIDYWRGEVQNWK